MTNRGWKRLGILVLAASATVSLLFVVWLSLVLADLATR